MIIDSKVTLALPAIYNNSQKFTLEGDFYKFFDVYTPKGYEISALSLLAPTIMESVISLAGKYDIEIVGRKLYLYSLGSPKNGYDIENMIETTRLLIKNLKPMLKDKNILPTKELKIRYERNTSRPTRIKYKKYPPEWIGSAILAMTVLILLYFKTHAFIWVTASGVILFAYGIYVTKNKLQRIFLTNEYKKYHLKANV